MLTIQEICDECQPLAYRFGRDLFLKDAFIKVDIKKSEEYGDVIVSGKIRDLIWQEAWLALDMEDRIVDYNCQCTSSKNFKGMCRHCAALALKFRQLRTRSGYGDTSQASLEVKRSGVLLKSLLSKHVSFKTNVVGLSNRVNIYPKVTVRDAKHEVSFDIGIDVKYPIRNLYNFLHLVENCEFESYGRSLRFTHQRSAFTSQALGWIDFMMEYLRSTQDHFWLEDMNPKDAISSLILNASGMDQLLTLCVGSSLIIDGEVYKVIGGPPKLAVTFEPKEAGLEITMELLTVFEGSRQGYIFKDGEIYQCGKAYMQDIWPILKALGLLHFGCGGTDFTEYLAVEDYGSFCSLLWPVLEKYMDVSSGREYLADFMEIAPIFNIYIGLDDESELSVRAEAVYDDRTYLLMEPDESRNGYRNWDAEQHIVQKLHQYFVCEDDLHPGMGSCRKNELIAALLTVGIDELKEYAQLYIDERIRKIKILNAAKVTVGVSIRSGLLDFDIRMAHMTAEEITDVLRAYQRKRKFYRLRSGDFMKLEDSGLPLLSQLITDLSVNLDTVKDGTFQVPAFRCEYVNRVLDEVPDLMKVHKNRDFRKLISELQHYEKNNIEVPKVLDTVLRNYQKEGFLWLATLDAWGFGGILADDMGLGKTIQAIALLAMKRKSALIVCPASLVYNWENEFGHFAPDLEVKAVVGTVDDRQKIFEHIRQILEPQILITSYDLLKKDVENYQELSLDTIIVDEAQYIKNRDTLSAKTVKLLDIPHRFALTGTPVENRLSDLWSIFDFIMPGYLYDYKKFRQLMEVPMVKGKDAFAGKRLKALVSPFILRRKKSDVLKDLPEKLEEVVYTRLEGEQKSLYDAHVSKIYASLSGQSNDEFKNQRMAYLAELTRLRQLCCAPELCYENYQGPGAKLELCMELVQNAVDGGHRILLFSQFTSMLDILDKSLKGMGIEALYLSGKTSKEQRHQMVEAFQQGNIPVFLISLKAGGTGLNLTMADIVIHYDPWWNVAAQTQAADRTHRIGQKKTVTVIKLVARDTIEEKILRLQEEKADLAENIIEGNEIASDLLQREALMKLLEEH